MARSKIFTEAYRGEKRFIPFPRRVLDSEEITMLSSHATKLLVDFLAMSNGKNNGDLCATWSMMKKRGWTSGASLSKAKAELIEKGFIVLTRQGGRNKADLYGLTFYAIDECNNKLDVHIKPTIRPPDNWKIRHPVDIKKARKEKIKNDAKKDKENAKNQLKQSGLTKQEKSFYSSQIERCDDVIRKR